MAREAPRMARAAAAAVLAVVAGTAEMEAGEARERQRLRHAQCRGDMDDEEAAEQRERDRLRHALHRDDMDDEEAAEQRERDRLRHALHRDDMDDEEAAEARQRRRDPVTADTLPRRFLEQPTCVCSSCRRRHYCSAGSGTRPQQVICRPCSLTACPVQRALLQACMAACRRPSMIL
jgi:hypothetical protein